MPNLGRLGWEYRSAGSHEHSPSGKETLAAGAHRHLCEDKKILLSGGDHWHDVDGDKASGGEHCHFFLMPDGKWALTEPGGKHEHEVTPETNTPYETGVHDHVLALPDGKKIKTLNVEQLSELIVFKSETQPWEGVL